MANAASGFTNDSMQTVINIKPAPRLRIPAFNILPETGAPSNAIQFINNSTGASQYEWDFGDGSAISNVANATHVYADTGSYLVTLTAQSIYGFAKHSNNNGMM
ncbi:MAG: PKD domain-containing protein [Bacteroidia bacterium]